ncbi:MAG TPA: hypothetical protein VGX76_08540 [Pirellulales bacterium]|nr:hypothetical protein [Pirellulales bacterium]
MNLETVEKPSKAIRVEFVVFAVPELPHSLVDVIQQLLPLLEQFDRLIKRRPAIFDRAFGNGDLNELLVFPAINPCS